MEPQGGQSRTGGYLKMEASLQGPEETELSQRGTATTTTSTNTATSGDTEQDEGTSWAALIGQFVVDLVASVAFWYGLGYLLDLPDTPYYIVLGSLGAAMVAWRLYRAYGPKEDWPLGIPYTCGYVSSNGKEVFLVATLHISPRAPRDVQAVIDLTNPDVAMIELDEERLDRMRDSDALLPAEPDPEDLQPVSITVGGRETLALRAQRALWNAEQSGTTIAGDVVFDAGNAYGLQGLGDGARGNLALVHRGAPSGEFAPFSLKAHNAGKARAEALLVIDYDHQGSKLPVHRIGGSASVVSDLRVAVSTCSCGFPPVPVLLLSHHDGSRLLELCKQRQESGARPKAELEVMPDHYPRRTLRLRLCQASALFFSGIGILYGIIQCFNVEVGAEFIAAEEAATARNIPCACIDVDLNQFWQRLGVAVLPTPCNLGHSLLAWLAFPRVVFRVLFPPRGNVDVMGTMVLHGASLSFTTWVAFILAGFCASLVTNTILQLLGRGAEKAAESTGVVKEEDSEYVQAYIMLAVELYMLPRIYEAVAASRDETMFRSIASKGRELAAQKMVVVVGAAHSNGILQRIRAHGL